MRVSEPRVRRDSKLFEELCAALLRRGQSVRFRVNGQSMKPNLQDGDDVIVSPARAAELHRGDVVLARTDAGLFVHRIAQVDAFKGQVITRGDSGLEHDAPIQQTFGKVTVAARGRKQLEMAGRWPRLQHSLRILLQRLKLSSIRRFKHIGSISGVFFVLFFLASFLCAPSASAQALSITDTAVAPTTVAPGATITFTQVLTNTSRFNSVTPNISVTQNLPAGTTFVSATPTGNGTWNPCTYSSATGVITCTETKNYTAGSTTTITVILTVNANVASGTVITDTVSAVGANTGTVTASASFTVQTPDLALTQTVAPSVVAPSTNFTYTEAVSNNGPTSTASGTVTLATQTPANATYQSYTGTNWACGTTPVVGGTGNIICTYTPALASGTSANNLTITMQVAAGTASGTVIQNSATVGDTYFADPYPYNNTSTSSITVEPAGTADLALTQTASPDSVAPGNNFVYTETVTDNGPAATTSGTVSVSTQTPANTTYQSYAGTSWTCTTPAAGATGNIVCTYNAALAVGGTANALTITVGVNSTAASGTIIQNSASVSNSTLTDPISSNNTSTTSVDVETSGTADLQLTQVASAPAVAAGDNYSYSETVVDNGPTGAATGTITAYMQTPPNTDFQAYAGTNWTCTTPAVGGVGPVVCTYNAALASGGTASTLTVTFQVAVWAANTAYAVGTRIVDSNGSIEQVITAGTSNGTAPTWDTTLGGQTTDNGITWQNAGTAAGTTIQSSATVTNSTLVDPIPSNNTSITSIVIEPVSSADMSLSMTVAPTPVFIATNLTYTIQVQNLGQISAPVTSNVLTDTLPSGTTFVSVTSSAGWSCSGTTTVSCSLTTPMAMGQTASIAITVTAPPSATTLANTATISLSGDPNSTNNSATAYTVVQPLVCATPGKDGAGGSLSGIVNAYYPPSTAGTLAAGSTQVALSAAATGGAQTTINAGDLLLVIQMQAAAVNDTNTSSYGHGVPGDPATGSTSLSSSGLFEFVTATNQVVAGSGGTLKFTGTGPTGGLLNNYYENAATSTQGQQTYQIIRVPQYTSATLSSALVPLAWTGSVGGVLAIDASSQLTLGGTVVTDGLGFRGGGGITLAGQSTGANTDYVTDSPANLPALNNTTQKDPPAGSGANGSKGEGIAGTPHWVAPALSTITTSSTAVSTAQSVVEGLPNGSFARGAPGTAGGGGTDGSPSGNTENSGGGAGANGGAGGQGGYGWDSLTATNSTNGGFGGTAFPASTSALVMGGGGGAGTVNNGSYYISSSSNSADCGTTCTGIYSSGGAGGGIVILHAASVAGTGTITANGQSTLSTLNDSTGGAGAGGSILVFVNSGGLSGLTVSAAGGSAGDAWPNEAPGGFPGQRHGPGGGGGGGVIFLSASPSSSNVSAGNNGYTDTVQDSYGATPGTPGVVVTTDIITETPGTQPGAYCASADLAVTNSGTPTVVAPGANITYTQTVTNNGPFDAVNAVFSEGIPANTTFQSIVPAAGWTCTTPAVGGTGNIACTNADFANAGTGTFTVVVQVASGTTTGTQIVDVDNITSGTSDPNLANNSATVVTSVGTSTEADLSITNTPSAATVVAGNNFTFTAVVTNNGPAVAASGAVFTETLASNNATTPTNAAFSSLVAPAGWTCSTPAVGATSGTITCTLNAGQTLGVGATATFPVVMTAPTTAASGTLPGMVLSSTAYIADSTPDPNTANNFATASIEVATSGQADLAVTSSGTPNPVTPGNNITYTQSVTNNGPTAITASATNTVTFTDTIPTNTTLASTFTAPTGWTCNTIALGGTGTFTCTLNVGQTLAVGAVVNFPLVVKVSPTTSTGATTVGTTITNTPTIASSVSDPNTSNNTTTVTTYVASATEADVSINKTASPNPVNQGTTLTYTLTVGNAGPAVAQNVTVTDALPAQVTYSSVSTTAGSCTYTSSTTTVSCNLGSLSVGGTDVITISVSAQTFSSSVYSTNTATVSASTTDPNPNNNSASFTSTIQSATAVDISAFNAYTQADGSVRLVWHTQEESRNLGFHVYREDGSGRNRVDTALIAGSALLLRGSLPQHAAKTYSAVDSQPSASGAYWLEDVDINGTRSLHGPVYPEAMPAGGAQSQALEQSAVSVSPSLAHLNVVASAASNSGHALLVPRPVTQRGAPVLPSGTRLFNAADQPAVKITADQVGWYHIPFSQLFAAGLNPYTDVRTLHLYAEGVEQPMLLIGHTSGQAAPTDAIEFYGTGIDTPFTADRAYWLVTEGSAGQRIASVASVSSETLTPGNFPFTVTREDRTVYFAALLNGENNDNFFGAVITSEPTDQTLNVVHLDGTSTKPQTLQIALQGATDQQQHSVAIQLNGNSVGTLDFYGEVLSTQSYSIDPSMLVEGTNTVTLTALDGDNDVSLVQSIQLQYPHTYTADSDWLQATVPAGSELQISGFANSQVRVFDITNPLNIFEISGNTTTQAGSYTVTAPLPISPAGQRTILAFAADTISAPEAITPHTPTLLDQQRAGADIVVITYPDFASHLTPLLNLRESQGHKVLVATTDQVFDDYSYGERTPFAVRSFLQDAVSRWQTKPQAVLLVGDASMDPRNYLGFGDFDFVPTRIIETAALKTASDDWFTDFLQNGYATIPTGRLPARTTADVDLLVSKIVNYEQGVDAGSWNAQALVVADQNVDSNFSSAAASATGSLPASLQTAQIYANGADPATVHTQIVTALNNGTLLVDYNGHGAEQQWSFADLFDNTDASALTNGNRLPVYLLIDCLNGLFQDVYAQSLSKALILAPNGGAVAVWSSSGFTTEPPQASMNIALLQQLAANPNDPLGLMILRAKNLTTDNDVRRTWNLLGDPSMTFHFAPGVAPASASHTSSTKKVPTNLPMTCPRGFSCLKETPKP